jgi:outer membrane protein OmpA-like peptidoglycan-associated protein
MINRSVAAFLLLTVVNLTAYSQSFVGYGYDNYSGVNAMILNPASLADNKYKVNVNLFAISAMVGNNAYEMDRSRLFGFHFSNLNEGNGFYKSANTDYKYFYTNLDILGPSATISLTSKDAIGITTRLRLIGNEYNLGDPLFRLTGNADPNFYNVNIENRSLQLKVNAFAEAGISYGRVLWRDDKSEFKLGITGKYVLGLGYGSVASGPLQVDIDPTNQILNLQGTATAQYSANLDNAGNGMSISDIINKKAGTGIGFDLGFVYEVKGATPSTEKFRLGMSVTDIGSINYTNSLNSQQYTLTATGQNAEQFAKQNGENFNDYFNRLQSSGLITAKGVATQTKVSLPTALHLNLDFEIYKRIYINGDVLLNMLSTVNPMSPNYITTFTVTPRLEKKWVSVYSPVSYNVNGQLNWGAGVRIGPLFVGSGSVLSSLMKQRIQTADAHVGLTIPIFKPASTKDKKPTLADTVYRDKKLIDDRDGDGVVDSKDQCPDSAGPIPLFGCPDDDGDGVPNYKDKCPQVKGSPNFQGCPAPDTDGDSVNDDDDKCPLVKGVKSNFGCPPINAEYINKVNRAADRVFFIRAKANIEPISLTELDRVVEVLQSDTTLRLRIEGYTDDEGPDAREIALSTRRARSVFHYLVKQGISAERMDYIGYGKSKPLAANDTPEGMAQNRRVEMILMNYPKDKKKP